MHDHRSSTAVMARDELRTTPGSPVLRRDEHGTGLVVSDVSTTVAGGIFGSTAARGAHVHADDVAIDSSALDEFARRVLGRERFHVEFRGWTPETPQATQQWREMVAYVQPLVRRGLTKDPVLGRPLQDLILATFLRTFPTNIDDPATAQAPATAAVGRAIRYLEDHFAKPVRMADVVAASRLSPRGLQAAFQRELSCTPTVYLRRIRLGAAHRQLRLTDSTSSTTVAEIARAAGFTHIGRFSMAYRDAYGESPRETLRR
jgi:AraC-like DNA-binding protein